MAAIFANCCGANSGGGGIAASVESGGGGATAFVGGKGEDDEGCEDGVFTIIGPYFTGATFGPCIEKHKMLLAKHLAHQGRTKFIT